MMDVCIFCQMPYRKVKKFNSGNPKEIKLPSCDCDEVAAEANFNHLLDSIETRKNA